MNARTRIAALASLSALAIAGLTACGDDNATDPASVSYTHLTLPTICSV